MPNDTIYEIDMKLISVSKLNVRVENATTGIDELAASIRKHGLLQPVVLHGEHGNPPYELIAGQRRFLAHQRLKAPKIRCVFAGTLSKTQATLHSLVENLQRLDLNHADAAKAITDLYKDYDRDERRVQRETGLPIQRVRGYISVEAQATNIMKKKLRAKKVTIADVKRAIRAANGSMKKAEELLTLMEKYPLNKHQKKRIVEYADKNQHASADTIIQEAMKPRVEQSIMVGLPEEVRKALERAVEKLSKEAEEILSDVLREWLAFQGYMK